MRTVSSKWRDDYRHADRNPQRRRFEAMAVTSAPTDMVQMFARRGYHDWNGSAAVEAAAIFAGVEDGWLYNGKVYPSLLSAVRQAIRDGH